MSKVYIASTNNIRAHRYHQASKQAKNATTASEDNSHILGIISSLFTHLESDSPSRIRLLAKFVENDYEKVDKLLELRENARKRLRATDTVIEEKKKVRDSISDRPRLNKF